MRIKPDSLFFSILLSGLSALPPLSIDMNLASLPAVESSLGVGAGQGALTLSLFLLGFAIAPILGGPLADRFGRRPTLLAALTVTALGAFCCVAAPTFRVLLGCRLIQGAASGVCVIIPLAIVRDILSGHEARRQLSRIMAITAVAPMVAPIIGGWIFALAGWRAIYGAQGVFALALLACVAAGFAETLPPERRLAFNFRQVFGSYRTILTDRTFVGFAFCFAFCFGCMFAYISGSPGLLIGEMGLSEQVYALIFAVTSGGVLTGSAFSGRLNSRGLSPRLIVSVCLAVLVAVVSGVLGLVLADSVNVYALVPLLCVLMFCCGIVYPNAMNGAVEPHKERAGTASGAVCAFQFLCGSGSSALVSFLSGLVDAGRAMSLAMSCALLLAVTIFALAGRRDKDGYSA